MAYWLLKTEPATYSYADLERDGTTVWDGVRNAQALIHLRAMRSGDDVLIYHSGEQRAIVGTAAIAGDPYADPRAGDPKLTVVDVQSVRRLGQPVGLAAIKADAVFEGMALVRQPRLSVMPVTDEQWNLLMALAQEIEPTSPA